MKSRNLGAGNELYTTLEVWTSQVKSVLQMCAHISNHLDYSKKSHAKDEAEIAAALTRRDGSSVPASELLKYMKRAFGTLWGRSAIRILSKSTSES